jgi:hypothetical protein
VLLTDSETHLLLQVSKQFPDFGKLLTTLRQNELERMALSSPDTFPTLKGRVGVLTDLLKHVVT